MTVAKPSPADRPRLRRGLAAAEDPRHPGRFILWDQLRVGTPIPVSRLEIACAELCDGKRGLREIQLELMRQAGGVLVPAEALGRLVARLDEALMLDSPRFREYIDGPVREPSCVGCYSADPDELRRQCEALFTADGGPGLPQRFGPPPGAPRLRAVLVPHMDYARGGVTYGWGFRELAENTDASLFVIIATSHYSPARFTLTRQHFKTPLGTVSTDLGYIDRLAGHYGDGLFDDPVAHLPEHSIELEVVLLQYLFAGRREVRIVPLLVGSFQDHVDDGRDPDRAADVARMIAALRRCEAETGEPVCYLISGDLAHIGPKFGDPRPVGEPWLSQSRALDRQILERAVDADAAGYFRAVAGEGDTRRICGLPPTYTTLAAAKPGRGKLLRYDQYVDPSGHESVSFASVAFYE